MAVSQPNYDVKNSADRFKVFSSSFQTLKIHSTQAVTGTSPRDNNATFTANASTNFLTSAGHGLENGEVLNFTTDGTLPAPLIEWDDEYYYVINKTTNTFQVSLTLGGSAVDITDTGSGTHDWWTDESVIDIYHNLEYLPPYVIIYNGSSTAGVATSYYFSDADGNYITNESTTNRIRLFLNNNFDSGGGTAQGDTIYFTVYVFLDDFRTVAENNINTGVSSGASSTDYGERISKTGYDVKTCTDEQCVLSSSFFNQIVHKKGIDTSGDSTVSISHNLGYEPAAIAFIKVGDNIVGFPNTLISSTDIKLVTGGGIDVYYIIFKSKLT